MEFGVLGPLMVRHEGREIEITSGQQRCVLALLLLEVDRAVPLARLVALLWEDGAAPRTARNVVQRCVSELRRLMRADPRVRLAHTPAGYVLEADPGLIDLHRFRSLVATAPAGEQAAGLRRALALWRGEPLADIDVPGLTAIRHVLVEERLAVLENCLEAEVESGRTSE
ncbi:AfsR/SARP family transcriptional regulator [Saccharothrix lopnurensis]|uniref:BTAD domain-containing putative transcriptional regulator n=1 Tax=Saccharothrix lopnurensis TaxID=1670621 RepID=A0ABW1PIQ9_9PSEU